MLRCSANDDEKNPYLKDDRLADVIAALQIMGTYPWAKREVDSWAKKLGDHKSGGNWKVVFKDHPEFFSLVEEQACLRWRFGYRRNYDVYEEKILTEDEIGALSEEKKNEITRKPLENEQVETLIKTAIELHSRAIAHEQEKRWLTPLLFALLGIILGAVLQAAIR
jgi:hypothetical protein